jgi:hypothetical protein
MHSRQTAIMANWSLHSPDGARTPSSGLATSCCAAQCMSCSLRMLKSNSCCNAAKKLKNSFLLVPSDPMSGLWDKTLGNPEFFTVVFG